MLAALSAVRADPPPEKEVAVTVPATSNAVVGAVVLPIATLCAEKTSPNNRYERH